MAKRKVTQCKMNGCKKPAHAQGYCQSCYDNMRKKKKVVNVKNRVEEKKKALPLKLKNGKTQPRDIPAPVTTKLKVPKRGSLANAHPAGEENVKAGRVGLIKTRHEAIKREIEQIREDLESDEEE